MNSSTISNDLSKTFEQEFTYVFNDVEMHVKLITLSHIWNCDFGNRQQEFVESMTDVVFSCMTDEQLEWCELHTANGTPYGIACRKIIAERILLGLR